MTDQAIPFLQTFRTIRLTNADQQTFNITPMVAELSIFSDIYANYLTGELVMADGLGGISHMGIRGAEKLTVELVIGESVSIHDFYVYAISNRTRLNDTSEGYKLSFMSVEGVLNEHGRISQAYSGQHSESVKKIVSGYLASQKKVDAEPTLGNFKFVMPSWSPFECINWYAGRSRSTEGSYYLFYETLEGFQFKSVEGLLKKSPKYQYHYSPAGITVATKDLSNIREYEVLTQSDGIRHADSLNTTLWNHDLIRKKIVKQRSEAEMINQDKNGFGLSLKERRDVFGNEIILRNETRNTHTQTQDYGYEAIQKKRGMMAALTTTRIRFLAHGSFGFDVGDVVTLKMLKAKSHAKGGENADDDSLTGDYLVTAIRRQFKHQDYHMTVEVAKV